MTEETKTDAELSEAIKAAAKELDLAVREGRKRGLSVSIKDRYPFNFINVFIGSNSWDVKNITAHVSRVTTERL